MRSFRLLAVALVAAMSIAPYAEAGCFGAGKARRQARRMARQEARQAACEARGAAYVTVAREYSVVSYPTTYGLWYGYGAGSCSSGAAGACGR